MKRNKKVFVAAGLSAALMLPWQDVEKKSV